MVCLLSWSQSGPNVLYAVFLLSICLFYVIVKNESCNYCMCPHLGIQ